MGKIQVYQDWNYKFTKTGIKILNVKERNPLQRFKGVPVKRQWRK